MKPFCFTMLFSLTCCHHPTAPSEKKENFTNIDLHDYMLPTSDLLQGKVYCFADSTGAYKRFEYDRETLSGGDTVFESIDYDSSFTEKGDEKDRLSNEGITPVSVETFQNGISNPAQVKSGPIPWIHPLQSGDTSLHMTLVMRLSIGPVTGNMDAGFDSVADESLPGSYTTKDCIQENLVFHVDGGGPSKPFHSVIKDAYCLCKGVGKVGSTSSAGKKLLLKKIISKPDFDAMKGQH